MEDHFGARAILKGYGVTLRSVTDPIGGENPTDKLLEVVLAGFSDFDNSIRTLRATNGMVAKIRQGLWPWNAPTGYMVDPKREKGTKKTQPDIPNPATFSILQQALRECANHEHTLSSFAARLDALGLAAIRGKKSTLQFAQQILEERRLKFYAGILSSSLCENDSIGLHEPMLTQSELENVFAWLRGKRKSVQHYTRFSEIFPLRGGTVLCGSCNRPLTGSSPRGHGGVYFFYHCYNKMCTTYGKSISRDTVEADFVKHLNKIAPTKKFVELFKRAVLKEWTSKVSELKNSHSEYAQRRRSLETRLVRIRELREDGSYTKQDYLDRKSKIESEMLTLKISESESHIEQMDMEALLEEGTSFLTSLGNHWKNLSPQAKPRFQKLVYPEGIPYAKGVGFGTAKMGRIFELNQKFLLKESYLVRPAGFEPATNRLRGGCSTN